MELTWEKLVVALFFVLPGFVALHVYDLVVAPRRRPTLEMTLWSLVLSVAGAAVAGLWVSNRLLAAVLSPSSIGADRWLGSGALLLSGIAVGGASGIAVRRLLKGNLGDRLAYPTAWDGLWVNHARERRFIYVDTPSGYFRGTLEASDDGASGRALVLRRTEAWNAVARNFCPTGAELSFFASEQVRRIDLSVESVDADHAGGTSDERRETGQGRDQVPATGNNAHG